MTDAVRNYLKEVVRIFEMRKRNRGSSYAAGSLKVWEEKMYLGALALLKEEQTDLPLTPAPSHPNSPENRIRDFNQGEGW